VLQELPDAASEILESWDAENLNGERAVIPAGQLVARLQIRQKEAKNQHDVILIASAVAAVLIAVIAILVLVWKKGLLYRHPTTETSNPSDTEGGIHVSPDDEISETQVQGPRFVS
jgi:hypothetical protein